ncbi:MAG: glucose-1-phosphate adenylyltransferase [Pseudohongiella sp.]|nr:glucose-1-phosphate adenylyltransferase [Pseudohongiella sp.]
MTSESAESCQHVSYCQFKSDPHAPVLSALTNKTYAVVLAGGRGTRLKQLTDNRSKPAVPFGGKLRIIDFPLSNCINSGIRRVGVVTQYKAQSLLRHIQRGWGFLEANLGEFIEALPAQQRVQEAWYTGTADAVFQNLYFIRHCNPEYILVLGGDHVYKMNYGRVIADHIAARADLTICCIDVPLEEASQFGIMTVGEDQRITGFNEKPPHPQALPGDPTRALASMGIYVFSAAFLYEHLARDAQDSTSSHDFGKDLIPYMVEHHRVFAHRFATSCVNMVGETPYWRDVGTVDAYWEANMDLTKVTPGLNLYDADWPIWSLQQQLPPAKFVFNDDDGRRGHALDSLISSGCIISGAEIQRSLLFTNVRVREHSVIADSVILPDVEIGRHVTLHRVIVDKGCHLPDGFTAGVDLRRDRELFHVTPGGVTLISADMPGLQSVTTRIPGSQVG